MDQHKVNKIIFQDFDFELVKKYISSLTEHDRDEILKDCYHDIPFIDEMGLSVLLKCLRCKRFFDRESDIVETCSKCYRNLVCEECIGEDGEFMDNMSRKCNICEERIFDVCCGKDNYFKCFCDIDKDN